MAKKQNVLKLKLKICLFPAPDRPLKNLVTRNIFLQQLFFLVTGSSDVVPEFTFRTGLHF